MFGRQKGKRGLQDGTEKERRRNNQNLITCDTWLIDKDASKTNAAVHDALWVHRETHYSEFIMTIRSKSG